MHEPGMVRVFYYFLSLVINCYIATLLEETADQRNKWIRKESPTVAVIFHRFLCLRGQPCKYM